MKIILVGDIVNGFKFYGPFTEEVANAKYTELNNIAKKTQSVWIVGIVENGA